MVDFNATQAAIRSGYSEKTAYSTGQRVLKTVEVQKYISEQMEKMHDKNTADAKEVLEYLTAVMRGQSDSNVLAFVGEGCQEAIKKKPDERERLRAAELLGKRYGLYTDKVDIDADVKLDVTVDYGDDDPE